jgi:hypothetical protein
MKHLLDPPLLKLRAPHFSLASPGTACYAYIGVDKEICHYDMTSILRNMGWFWCFVNTTRIIIHQPYEHQ